MIVTLPDLLDRSTLESVRQSLVGAPWQDGKGSAHGKAREAKHNLVVPVEHPVSVAAGRLLLERLSQHEGFKAAALPKVILPLKFCRYDTGMGYGDHLDLPLMGTATGGIRTDISVTVFLSEGSDYEGGDLVFESEYGTQRVRGQAGEAVLYPASTLHRVEPVVRGTRLVAISWIQSLVRDAAKRKLLFDLAQVATSLDASGSSAEEARTVRKSQFNLLRMWAEQ
ncbi:MAG: Fe2+-dependent dioxygenase [Myxococcales bacterium]|nr:MAG: Fe2+-dependent dioxygenase [Myxococcales bacterium]